MSTKLQSWISNCTIYRLKFFLVMQTGNNGSLCDFKMFSLNNIAIYLYSENYGTNFYRSILLNSYLYDWLGHGDLASAWVILNT